MTDVPLDFGPLVANGVFHGLTRPKEYPRRGYAPYGCPEVLVFENLEIRGAYFLFHRLLVH